MNKNVYVFSFIFLFSSTLFGNILFVQGLSVPLEVSRAVWGEDPDSPIKVYPGDSEVQFIVEVQNLSPDRIIKGISGTLNLEDSPFTDIYGNPEITTTGEPSLGDILEPTDEVKPKGFFTFTFTLDIDENAVPGSYSHNLIIDYSIEASPGSNQTYFIDGTPKTLNVNMIISKVESTIEVSVSPEISELGESVRVSGGIDPSKENAEITLLYKSPNRSSFSINLLTNIDGTFAHNIQTDAEGFWSVNASWLGDEKYMGDSFASSFEVRLPVHINILTSNKRIIGGLDNQFNITIKNSGEVAISDVNLSFDNPEPLVIHGETSWIFNYLNGGDSSSIHLDIYAPANAIGSTYTGSLTVNYRDDYDESHEENFPIGLIVVGRVELVISDKTVNPQLASNGSKFEVSMTLLNKGNVAAMYTNASIIPNSELRLTKESLIYIGEVEDNSQVPFTLIAYIDNNVENGTYPINVDINFRDDQYIEHSISETVYITVVSLEESQDGSTDEGTLWYLSNSWLVFIIVVVASLTIMLLYRRHNIKRKERNFNKMSDEK
jgi:hypothetical protein